MSNSIVKKRVILQPPPPDNNLISKIFSYLKKLLNKIFILFILLLISILFILNYIINHINDSEPVKYCEKGCQELTEINKEIKQENDKLKKEINEIQLLLDKNKSELEKCNKKSELANKILSLISLPALAHIAEIADSGIPEVERNKIYYSIFYNKQYLEIINDIDEYNKTSKDLSHKDKITDFEKKITNKICEAKQDRERIIGFLCQLSSVQTLPK